MATIEKCISDLWTLNKQLVNTEGLKNKDFVKQLYEYAAELLIINNYVETSIEDILGTKIYETLDYNVNIKKSDFKNIQDITNYLYETTNRDDYSILTKSEEFTNTLYDVTEYFKKLIEEAPEEDNTKEITEVLENIDKSNRIESGLKKKLVTLLEKDLKLFSVDVKDKSGLKRKFYKINPKSNTYEEINRGWLQKYLTNKYPVKLHETPKFYEDILDRIYEIKEVNNNFVEFENIYIDKRNYNITNKKELNDIFTEDRLYYEDYETNDLKLFRYDEKISIYDVLGTEDKAPNIAPTLATDTFIKIFVPKTEPNNIQLLQYILQTIGMMLIGRNPAKRITILYDETEEETGRVEGDSGKSTACEIIKEMFKNGVADLNDKVLKDNFTINSIEQATHFLFMDELEGNELREYMNILKRFSSGYKYNGRMAYGDDQTDTDVPPIIIAMNGVPKLPLHDKPYLKRYVLAKVPNVFKPEEEVSKDKNEYPEVSNILEQIKKDSKGLSQLISIAINEYITLNHDESIRKQLALNPSIEETIAITSKSDIVLGILKAYTRAEARTTNKNSWVSISELQDKIKQVYKKSNDKEINPELINNQSLGYKLVELYPNLFNKENVNSNKKKYNGHNVYNITLLSNDELDKIQSEIIVAYPESDSNRIFDDFQAEIHKKISEGINTESKLINEYKGVYSQSDIMDALEELYNYNLIDYSDSIDFIE